MSIPSGQFLGYEKGEDGLPKIVESEAVTVRLIYRLILEGKTPSSIAKHLTTQARREKREQINTFLETLKLNASVKTDFDETLWFAVIDRITVYAADDIQFSFRDGTVIKVCS